MKRSQQRTVTSAGMAWTVASRNERGTEHKGRFFFARRCRSGRPWMIEEHDQSIVAHGSAKPLRVWRNNYLIEDLSQVVREICGEFPEGVRMCATCFVVHAPELAKCPECGAEARELHPSMSWDEYRASWKRQ